LFWFVHWKPSRGIQFLLGRLVFAICCEPCELITSFNGTGTLIWRMLEEPRELSALIGAVARECAVGPEQAEKDVVRFVDELLSVGLAEVCQSAAKVAEGANRQAAWATAASR
jgi:hypothetical protein